MNFIETNSDTLYVLLHGSKRGMGQSLQLKIFEECKKQGHSVVNFNFPFYERGEDHSSSPELTEEIETLNKVLVSCNSSKYKKVRFIGKSLGGIIGAKFLSNLDPEDQKRFSIIIFGYVTGEIDLKSFPGKIVIIQGERDRYGDVETVKRDMAYAISKDIAYHEIKNADHSFRNELKEPDYEDMAIEVLGNLNDQDSK